MNKELHAGKSKSDKSESDFFDKRCFQSGLLPIYSIPKCNSNVKNKNNWFENMLIETICTFFYEYWALL